MELVGQLTNYENEGPSWLVVSEDGSSRLKSCQITTTTTTTSDFARYFPWQWVPDFVDGYQLLRPGSTGFAGLHENGAAS